MNQHALIIGVEAYRDDHITPVRFARSEAEEWERLLKGTCQFQTVKVLAGAQGAPDEPTLHHVVDALYGIATTSVKSGDHFVLVFGGHGAEVNGRGYLMLSDCRSFSRSIGTLSLEALREDFLKRMPARWCTLILDSCRNDPEAGRGDGGGELGEGFFRDLKWLGERRRRDGRMTTLMSACQPGQRAHASNRFKMGVWSHFLHEGIRGAAWKEGVLGLRELAQYAHGRVLEWSATEPGERPVQEPLWDQLGTGEEVVLARDPAVAGPAVEPLMDEAMLEPLPEGGFGWYHGSPSYVSRMASKCSPGIWLAEQRIPSERTEWLVRQGVAEVAVRQGELVAVSSPEALIVGGQSQLLRSWLDGMGPKDGLAEVIGEFVLGKPMAAEDVAMRIRDPESAARIAELVEWWPARARSGDQRVPERVLAIRATRLMRWKFGRLIAHAWKRESIVEDWLGDWLRRTPESPALADLWIATALEAAHCLGSHDLINQFVEKMAGFCEETASLLAVAELQGRHLGQTARSGESLQQAEKAAVRAVDFADCSAAWQRLAGDGSAAQRCADAAARIAEECPDWMAVARARWAASREARPVFEALQRADRRVDGVLDRVDLAGAWVKLLGERGQAERMLLAAERCAAEACDWFLLGSAWGRILDGPGQASRCLNTGIGLSRNAFDWRTCAVAARELGVDPKEVHACVERAASVSVDARDWCWAADAAWTALDSGTQAEVFLVEARKTSRQIHDWLWCARAAAEPESAVEALEAAERLAGDPGDWQQCAEAWVRYGHDLGSGRRCLKRAEKACRSVLDWKECAVRWKALFLDGAGQSRCEAAAAELGGRKAAEQTRLSTRTEIPTPPDDR